MSIHIPPILVLFVCKVALAGVPDQNAAMTGALNLEWDTKNSMMTCRRQEMQLYDPAEGLSLTSGGDFAAPLNPNLAESAQCARTGISVAASWDESHHNAPWRVWRVGCPTPIVDITSGQLIGYKLPECPHPDIAICETDSVI
jgi:hypothetical protein